MDPLSTGTDTFGGYQSPEEADVVLFSRPLHFMPTNPFATLQNLANNPSGGDENESIKIGNIQKENRNPFSAFSDPEESEIEFEKRFEAAGSGTVYGSTTVPNNGPLPGNDSDEDRLDSRKISHYLNTSTQSSPADASNSTKRRQSTDNLNVSIQNSTGVRTEDVIFSTIIFGSHFLSFGVDVGLMCWYYWDEGSAYNFKWCSALTFFVLLLGSIAICHRFNQAEKDRLDRLFKHGRRMQVLVNSFPPLGTILCSYFALRSAWKAKREGAFSVHFFAIEEFARNLSRVQGFFQSAPQAALQLLILIETTKEISFGKSVMTISSVILSLTVMTIANLPGRSDMVETSVRKGIYNPVSRVFLGIRMISSFGSRTMALCYFLLGLRCVLGSPSTAISVVIGLSLIITPRLIFTWIDYCYHLHRVRRGREMSTGQFGRLSFCGTWTGYMATIFFPMSHPLWVFWFIWIETLGFVVLGFTLIITSPAESLACVTNLVNFIYLLIFLILFILIPFILPYARARMKRLRSQRIAKVLEQREREVENLQRSRGAPEAV